MGCCYKRSFSYPGTISDANKEVAPFSTQPPSIINKEQVPVGLFFGKWLAPCSIYHLYSEGIMHVSTSNVTRNFMTTRVFHLKLVPIATHDNEPLGTSAKTNSTDCSHTSQLAYTCDEICMRISKTLRILVFHIYS